METTRNGKNDTFIKDDFRKEFRKLLLCMT